MNEAGKIHVEVLEVMKINSIPVEGDIDLSTLDKMYQKLIFNLKNI